MVGTGLTMAAVAGAASAMPGGWARSGGRQAIVTTGAALLGFGMGSAVAQPAARLVGGGDAVTGGLLLGATGVALAIGGHHLPSGARLRDAGAVVSSIGVLTAAGGGAAALTSAIDGSDTDGHGTVASGAVAAAVLGTATLGVLAARGGLRRAPSVAEAARSIVTPSAASMAKWTPDLAKADYEVRSAAAKAHLLGLPGTSERTWDQVGKGRSFLRGVATPADIRETMGVDALRTPVRLAVGAPEAKGRPEEVARLMLERFDAANGSSFGTIHVVSPAAIGDTDEIVPLAVEHAKLGDTITLMPQTVQSEPFFVLQRLGDTQRTLRLVLEGLQQRIAAQPAETRSELLVSSLCYGSLAPVRIGAEGLAKLGVDHALLEGAPAFSRAARATAGRLERGEQEGLVAWGRADLDAAADSGRAAPRFTMHDHHDDPLRTGASDLLVPSREHRDRPFVPVISALNSFADFGADTPKAAGQWAEAGHQFQATGVSAANAAFGLGLTPSRRAAVQEFAITRDALRDIGRSAGAPAAA
ncbi:MAG: putative rane protein [Thermoleophilia bacterium]|nr:putative rane protein [Thermoleophilia bacterium]